MNENFNKGVNESFFKGNYEKAIYYFSKVIRNEPQNIFAYLNRGDAYNKAQQYNEAIADYNKAILINPNFPASFKKRGDSYFAQKLYSKAMIDYNNAVKIDLKYTDAYIGIGHIYTQQKEHKKAILAYNEALEINPNNSFAIYGKGLAFSGLKEFGKAISNYTKAINLNLRTQEVFINRGVSYFQQNQFNEAIIDFTTAINTKPISSLNSSIAYNFRGLIYYIYERYEDAVVDLNISIYLNPMYANAWESKAILHFRAKNAKYINKELAKVCFNSAAFLELSAYRNSFLFLDEYLEQPFLAFRLIQEKVHPSKYHQVASLLHKSFNQCNALYSFIAHQNLKRNKNYTEITWKKWLGIINYYMGDPIVSFRLLKSLVEAGSQDLMVYHYLILSCYDFAEDEELYIEKAIEIAECIRLREIKRQEDVIQCYYAGMLFWLDTEEEDALIYFSKIQKNFLPAAYQMLWLYHNDNRMADYNEIKESIIQRERKDNKYAKGVTVHYLDLENDTLYKPFTTYVHYFEVETAIDVFYDLANHEVDFIIQHSKNQKRFYELFKIRPEDLEATRLRADIAPYLEEWETTLKQTKPTKINVPTLDNFDLKNTFIALQNSVSKGEIEEDLGLAIQKFSLEVKQYEELLNYFYIKGYFTEYQKMILHFYIHYRSRQSVDSKHLSGLDKVVQEVVGGSLALMTGIITGGLFSPFVSASTVTAIGGLTRAYSKGTLGKLFTEWYVGNQSFKTYQDFKTNFEAFIGAERERLGDNKFDNFYPIQEFK